LAQKLFPGSYNSWLNAEILLFAIKNSIKKIFRNIWTRKKRKKRKEIEFFYKEIGPCRDLIPVPSTP
jgi:predicted KAP-like P-loop ATPase